MKVGWLNLGLLVNIRFSKKCSTCSLRETPDLLRMSWNLVILLMAEILHQLIGSLSHYL